jgi:hypothetical protein
MSNKEFKDRVLSWAKIININPKGIQIRKMKRKWTSCSSNGRLTFSKELMCQSLEFIDYVIVHELLHLRYPTHNKMFKLTLDIYLKEAEKIK